MPKVKKHTTVIQKHDKKHGKASGTPAVKQNKPKLGVRNPNPKHKDKGKKRAINVNKRPSGAPSSRGIKCSSVIDRQAAYAVERLVEADASKSKGASLKSLTLAPNIVNKRATYAVTCQVLKYLVTLQDVVTRAGAAELLEELGTYTTYVLAYELLLGQGLRGQHGRPGPAEMAVLRMRSQLKGALSDLMREKGAQTPADLIPKGAQFEGTEHPRSARVNTLRMSVQQALGLLAQPPTDWGPQHCKPWHEGSLKVDPLLPDVLLFPPGTDLHDHPLVSHGALILQSRASCMPAHALHPQKGWTIVDCCAAPGNKTTHAAAMLAAAGGGGKVLAYDKDPKRLARLKANVQRAGAGGIIDARLEDFLSLDPSGPEFKKVRGVILDPSCSGSGTVFTRMDHLLPSHHVAGQKQPGQQQQQVEQSAEEEEGGEEGGGQQGDAERIEQLARFQEAALRHALCFPALQRLVYSTCSLHERENEEVVRAVLPEAADKGFELVDPFPGWHRRGLPLYEGCDKLVRTDPYEDGTDGFFVAVFQRKAA
mmetsp:Transcript_40301/g.89498  ORF Transcript_40301/g.89498 Transcript_40301/m.89498 type:complete len:538 (+) Transcript_40301:127-1740(+)|eukprot:CAMPEP_0202919640 /NCGR_PEP_ID=MMETSP1392-20130828/76345_1 /ASSEMBLY_ACC=CAM_ASM_000868 /TAXON_ID=225041 /ORGANISM="Chlamydomonas chlamydogama, Strain SAG 11-48b" /LENGTH=537 /DNA_ID=CAMNT_0049613085 /DNA_START=87 /DNA_END=1700 /DNA_ORIENTATION=+